MSDQAVPTLLPPSAKRLTRDAEQVLGEGTVSVTHSIREIYDPELCPAPLLPWLAWALSVDTWEDAFPEETKRSTIANSISIHRVKGSVKAVRDAITAFGFGSATVVEGLDTSTYDGSENHDGNIDHGLPDHWAEYRVFLEKPITIGQAEELAELLKDVAPARCKLKAISYQSVANQYNAAIQYDGSFSHGEV